MRNADHVWRVQRAAGDRNRARGVLARLVIDIGDGSKPADVRERDGVDSVLSGEEGAEGSCGEVMAFGFRGLIRHGGSDPGAPGTVPTGLGAFLWQLSPR